MEERKGNQLLKRHPTEKEMKRVERIQEIIEDFSSGRDPDLKKHYESGLLAHDLKLEGYTEDEIGLAEIRIQNIKRCKAIGEAVNRGDIAPELLGEFPF